MKHLTLDNRIVIQEGLDSDLSIRSIAKKLDKAPSSILREIVNYRVKRARNPKVKIPCIKASICTKTHVCGSQSCYGLCRDCTDCVRECKDYVPGFCEIIQKPSAVCNACPKQSRCRYEQFFYFAADAHNMSVQVKKEAREGIDQDFEYIMEVDKLVSPLLKKGQSIDHIYHSHEDELHFSRSSFYRYVDLSVFTARNVDLPRRVKYHVRKKNEPYIPLPEESKLSIIKRRYNAFLKYMQENPEASVVEMDTVVGPIDSKKVLLTLLFRSCNLMVAFLLEEKTQENVINALNWLCDEIGIDTFKKLFNVILTDRGMEFLFPEALEVDANGEVKTKVFYCDPYCSWQKGALERNHEFIRYVLPKGTSFDLLEQTDITLLINHINSLKREKLNWTTPYQLSRLLLDNKLHLAMELKEIPPDEVHLKPSLIGFKELEDNE